MKITMNRISDINQFCKTANQCVGLVDLRQQHYVVNGKSIMGCFALNWTEGVDVHVYNSEDERKILEFCESIK